METTYLDCSWGSACVCGGGLCHHLERRALPESFEIFGKQASATSIGLGKEAKHGGF